LFRLPATAIFAKWFLGAREMRAALPITSAAAAIGIDEVNRKVYQRRRHIRYPIRVAVSVQWAAPQGRRGSLRGRTRDISEGGAFVVSRTLPPLGAFVELEIQLTARQTGTPSSRLEMQGEVLRVETPSNKPSQWGFAINATKTVMQGPPAVPVLDESGVTEK
jgi:PilZ domain